MKKIDKKRLLFFIVIIELSSALSLLLAGDIFGIYNQLTKPPFAPPDWLYGIVWPVLYLMMGTAGYLAYRDSKDYPEPEWAMYLYLASLFLNFLWNIIFFRFHLFWAAAVNIILIIDLVYLTAVQFVRINKAAGWLMLPYLFWIVFTAYLNIGVAILN